MALDLYNDPFQGYKNLRNVYGGEQALSRQTVGGAFDAFQKIQEREKEENKKAKIKAIMEKVAKGDYNLESGDLDYERVGKDLAPYDTELANRYSKAGRDIRIKEMSLKSKGTQDPETVRFKIQSVLPLNAEASMEIFTDLGNF